MYSWRQRADTTVLDEPFYAHYLTIDDRSHPGVDDVMATQSTDPDEVIRDVILGPCPTPVLYIKQMAHHLRGVDRAHLGQTDNILLVRDPTEMLASLSVQLPDCDLSDTGLVESVTLLDAILAEGGRPIVIDSQRLLRSPTTVLTSVCERLGLAFDPAMLSWPAGPKLEDGSWAQYWYDSVHQSTGFAPYEPSSREVPDYQTAALEEAVPLYERLAAYAVD